jgi:hydroxyacyl-ACP dehydratase HTD2-like protein with hotdog domain
VTTSSTGPVEHGNLAAFSVCPGVLQVFSFSAATWNPHRIHYDRDYTVGAEGYDGILVQGPLLGSWLLELAERWVKDWGRVEQFTFRTVQPVQVGVRLEIAGKVTELEPSPRAAVWVAREDGTRVAVGEVVASAPRIRSHLSGDGS